jgi:hypothetical protein
MQASLDSLFLRPCLLHRPSFPLCIANCLPGCGTHFPALGLHRFRRSSYSPLDLGPSCFLRQCHLSPRSGAELLSRGWGGFGCATGGATGQHGPKLCNPKVNPALLFLEAKDGGMDYFGGDFGCGHVVVRLHSGTTLFLRQSRCQPNAPHRESARHSEGLYQNSCSSR